MGAGSTYFLHSDHQCEIFERGRRNLFTWTRDFRKVSAVKGIDAFFLVRSLTHSPTHPGTHSYGDYPRRCSSDFRITLPFNLSSPNTGLHFVRSFYPSDAACKFHGEGTHTLPRNMRHTVVQCFFRLIRIKRQSRPKCPGSRAAGRRTSCHTSCWQGDKDAATAVAFYLRCLLWMSWNKPGRDGRQDGRTG